MKTLKSKLFFMTTLMMVITVFAGCPHKPINPPEPPEEDSTETIKQQLEFKVVWKNTIGVDLEISSESNSVDGATINAISALLKDGEETEFSTVNKLVEIDSAHTLEMYKQEMLSSVVNSLIKISLRYFENGTMYSFSDNGELFKNINDYSEINDSLIRLNITKELFSREEFAITEGEEKSVEIKWQNKFTLPITLNISSEEEPNLNISLELQPDEIVKLSDLTYYVYPNEDELNKQLLENALMSYHDKLRELYFILPMPDDNGEWTTTKRQDALRALKTFFSIDRYDFSDDIYSLKLYNKMLYIESVIDGDPKIKQDYKSLEYYWKNDMDVPMNIDIRYKDPRVYNIEGDIVTTLQPGEILKMHDFFIYEDAEGYEFQSTWDILWNGAYIGEIESMVITYGDKSYDKNVDGKRDFLVSICYSMIDGKRTYSFTEKSFEESNK